MRVDAAIDIDAPPEVVWEWIDDPARTHEFMSGITRWEVVGDQRRGCGTRVRMLLRVGSADVGGIVEIVEHVAARELAWTSITGVDQRGRWRLRARPPGRTRVELRLAYGVAGAGIPGWIAELVAAPTVRGHIERSLERLKHLVEREQARARAARRRARTGAAPAAT